MPSADFCQPLVAPLDAISSALFSASQIGRSPRVMRIPVTPSHLRPRFPDQFRALTILVVSPSAFASCASCSSVQRFACGFLQIPPRGGHPCRPASSSPDRACEGLSPPRSAPCRAYQKKGWSLKNHPFLPALNLTKA